MNTTSDRSYSIGRALGLWVLYTLILFLFGGIVAGITWLVFLGIFDHEISDVMYAITFGVTGYLAVTLMRPVVERRID